MSPCPQLNSLEQFEDKLRRELEIQQKSRNDTLSAGKSRPDTTLLDLTSSAAEVASQLKIIELERLCAIGPEEFIQTFVRGTEKAVRLLQMISHVLGVPCAPCLYLAL